MWVEQLTVGVVRDGSLAEVVKAELVEEKEGKVQVAMSLEIVDEEAAARVGRCSCCVRDRFGEGSGRASGSVVLVRRQPWLSLVELQS